MQSYNARYASFAPQVRSKSSSKGSLDLKWPHPASFLATPTSLASAGFYFNPSAKTPDAVSCFICDKGLADWDPEDDPAEIHSQKCPKCPWAMLKCVTDVNVNGSLKFISASRFPSSRAMEKARLATFGPGGKKWWPHDAKNQGPTSKTMAKAGFIYSPVDSNDDTCICIYCGIELAGWEPEDDPMEEHRSRQAKRGPCPFFTGSGDPSESTKRIHSKSKPPPTTPVASSSDQEYHPHGTRSSTRTSTSKRPGGSAKPRASVKTSTKKATKTKAIEEEVVAEYFITLDTDEDAPPKPRPKSRRASSRSRSQASSTRSRSQSSSTRSRSQASSIRSVAADDADVVPLVSSGSAQATLSKSKSFQRPKDLPSSSRPATTDQLTFFQGPEDIATMSSISKPVMQALLKSFQSPEDDELAREEQALEEQARQLMLADATLDLDSSLPQGSKSSVKSHHDMSQDVSSDDSHRAPSVIKGKGKAKTLTTDKTMNNNGDISLAVTPSTPSRTAVVITKTASPSVAKSPQLLPEDSVAILTDAERAMTVEQWIRHEMDHQYERLQSDGRQKIDAFKARAVEVARTIEQL